MNLNKYDNNVFKKKLFILFKLNILNMNTHQNFILKNRLNSSLLKKYIFLFTLNLRHSNNDKYYYMHYRKRLSFKEIKENLNNNDNIINMIFYNDII